MEKIAAGTLNFAVSIIGGIGGFLLFFGVFTALAGDGLGLAFAGAFLSIFGEGVGAWLFTHAGKKAHDAFRANFWGTLGAIYSLPLLFSGLYLFSGDRFLLLFSFAILAGALPKTAGMALRMAWLELSGQ